jgi:hypothetical protein
VVRPGHRGGGAAQPGVRLTRFGDSWPCNPYPLMVLSLRLVGAVPPTCGCCPSDLRVQSPHTVVLISVKLIPT